MNNYNSHTARQFISDQQSTRKPQPVATPWWSKKDADGNEIGLDGHVAMRKLKADEALDLVDGESQISNKQFMAQVLAKSLVLLDTGEPLFDEKGLSLILQEDMDEVKELFKMCAQYNGLGKDSKEQALGNSEATRSSDSTTK